MRKLKRQHSECKTQNLQNRLTFFLRTFFILSLSLIFIPPTEVGGWKSGNKRDDYSTTEVLSSDQTGVTLRLTVEDLSISEQKIDGKSYHVISYKDCQNTSQPSNPKIPVSRVMLGVPIDAECVIRVIDFSPAVEKYGYRILPVPEIDIDIPQGYVATEKYQTTKFVYKEDGPAYQSDQFYPSKMAKIVNDGILRDQRIVTIELCPIQYSPRRKSIRVYSTLTVRVDFKATRNTLNAERNRSATRKSPRFEKLYRANLINYDSAIRFRKEQNAIPFSAPSIRQSSDEIRYKIYVEKTGIYRLTYEELRDLWDVDLSGYDARYFRMLNHGKEIRIYVKGESDGSFDPGDYIEFFGTKTDNRYSRWNVYYLICQSTHRGMRVAEMEGQPHDPTATIAQAFRAKLYFEKDLLHNVLPHVPPEQVSGGDPHTWFEALDHWFWAGIKSSSEKTEIAINFKLYDVAQSFDQPEVNVLLQGGTPAAHSALISINDAKIATAEWYSQDEVHASKLLHSSNSLVDATLGDNVIRLSKVDSEVNKDAMKYPYHFYINRFDTGYTRLLYAVNDQLIFETPKTKDDYSVRKRRNLQYTIKHFLDPEIEIFEYEGNPQAGRSSYQLVSRIRNIEFDQVEIAPEDRERLIEMFRSNQRALENDNFVQETVNPKFVNLSKLPDFAYNATFQYPDSHDAHFIAISKEATLRPIRIELDQINDLRDTSNQADYIIITHPSFLDAAKRLAEWRETQNGGAHHAKVVDVTDIYDEFNFGMVSPQAIKDFLTFAFFNWTPPKVVNVLIFGDGTFDFRGLNKEIYDEAPELTGFIPPHYLWSTYGQTASDHWFATVSGIDALPDFFIGRIPVEAPEEASAVVDKLINYEKNPINGPWRRRIVSVADDEATNSGDFIFKKSLNEISQNHTLLGYSTTKIFLEEIIDKLEEDPNAFEEHLPGQVARRMINEELSKGAVIIQYSGHGGRVVWAHEIILDNDGVKELDNTDKLPFVIVLSCYNGYFDRPGEPSMAETFLRVPRAGSIGVFSATRLTFGSGNEALNKVLFDEIFRRDMRTLGEICFSAKVETMVSEGISQLEMMEDYTLFGDPATKLFLADYEIQPELENYTVAPNQKLQLKKGQLYDAVYNKAKHLKEFVPISDFSGEMTVTVRFPGYREVMNEGLEIKKNADVVNGKYPAIEISVPSSVESGSAVIEFYAESTTEIAVGGVSFSVEIPKILDVKNELSGKNSFVVSVSVSDELGQTGIEQIDLEWYDPIKREWQMIEMQPSSTTQQSVWYSHNTPINLPENGKAVRYIIHIADRDGNTIDSDVMEFQPMEVPDFRVVKETESFESLIYYEIDYQNKECFLKAEIENIEDNEIVEPVEVSFYEGNPDLDENYLVDEDAHLIGKTIVSPESWQRRNPIDKYRTSINGEPLRAFELAPLNINWITVASIKVERAAGSLVGQASRLENGTHRIFVVVDGSKLVSETDEENNIFNRTIELNSQFVGDKELCLFSNDRVFDVRVPEGVLDLANQNEQGNVEQTVILPSANLSVVPSEFTEPVNQPDIEKIDLPSQVTTYELRPFGFDQGNNITTQDTRNTQSVTVELRFDLLKFRESIKEKIGLGGIADSVLTQEQNEQIKQAMNDDAKNISIFLWGDEELKWFKLDSEVVSDQNGDISEQFCPVILDQSAEVDLSNFGNQGNLDGQGNGGFRYLKIDENSGVSAPDRWLVLFENELHFKVEGEKSGMVEQDGKNQIGKLGEEFIADGISFVIDAGDNLFAKGDGLLFETRSVGLVHAATDQIGKFTLMISHDTIPPDVQFTVAGQNFVDGEAVSSTPQIQATISDDNGIDLFTREIEFLISENNGDFVPIEQEEYQISTASGANQIVLNYNPDFSPGRYELALKVYDLSGNQSEETVEFRVNSSTQLLHAMNYPNPFRTKKGTTITCEVTNEIYSALVKIYTQSGRLIRELEEEDGRTMGFLEFHWNGRDYDGRDVANGIYYATIILKREHDKDLIEHVKLMKLR